MRLTYKYEKSNGYGSVRLEHLPNDPFVDKLPYLDDAWQEQRNKLGQLEDAEEKLGVDLLILINALQNGIWCKEGHSLHTEVCLNADKEWVIGCWLKKYECAYYRLKDYGKTWALTKEELE